MLDQVLEFFDITPDYDLDVMKPGQTLFHVTATILTAIEAILKKEKPDAIMVQGDTTTTFTGALAGFYLQIPVIHLEAGLRSGRLDSPFPEEGNRKMTGHIANWHFAATTLAQNNLLLEGIIDNVHVVGNTVIDALLLARQLVTTNHDEYAKKFSFLDTTRRRIMITGHRRESFGKPFEDFCTALKTIATNFPDVDLVYPVHLNPNVQQIVHSSLSELSNIHLIEPLPYPELVWLMNSSYFVMTDSGGIQEEAPSLGKPILVTRDVTERMEGVTAGTAILVGTDQHKIVTEATKLLTNPSHYKSMSDSENPYGDGTTSLQILDILKKS
jgi:UDP-N-acetylglucosamine 2-epimerase (non-hydrolysing)